MQPPSSSARNSMNDSMPSTSIGTPLKPPMQYTTPFSPAAHEKPDAEVLFSVLDDVNVATMTPLRSSIHSNASQEGDLLVFDDEPVSTNSQSDSFTDSAPQILDENEDFLGGELSVPASPPSVPQSASSPQSPHPQTPTVTDYTIDPDDIFEMDTHHNLPDGLNPTPANSVTSQSESFRKEIVSETHSFYSNQANLKSNSVTSLDSIITTTSTIDGAAPSSTLTSPHDSEDLLDGTNVTQNLPNGSTSSSAVEDIDSFLSNHQSTTVPPTAHELRRKSIVEELLGSLPDSIQMNGQEFSSSTPTSSPNGTPPRQPTTPTSPVVDLKPTTGAETSPQQKKTPPADMNGLSSASAQQPAQLSNGTKFSPQSTPSSSIASGTGTSATSLSMQTNGKSAAATADDTEYDEEVTFDGETDEYVTYGQDQNEKLRQVNQYILGEKLGSGTYGKVVEAIDSKTLRRVAIKIMKRIRIKKIKGAEKRLKNEILINQKLKHQNVIEFYEVIHDENKGKIYLVIEFAGAGSLSQVIDSQSNQRLPLPDVHHFFRQLIKGIEYIHSQGVVHLDIKPDNLMISPDRVLKISDFGVSHQFKLFEGDRCKNFFGTPTFACPHIAQGKEFSGEKADIWACGVTLYFLITGKYPFEGESVFQLYENIVKGEYEMPDYIPDDLKDMIQKLLEPDEDKRPSAAEIKKHPWYMGDDRESMRNKEPLVDRWRSFSLSQTISKALHNSNLYHMSFKDMTEADLEMDRDKCTIL